MGGRPDRLALCGPSSTAITFVSMSTALLVEPVRRDGVSRARAGCRLGGWPQLGSRTVDAGVDDCALRGLAGHVHDGPRDSAGNHATGHDLEWWRGREAKVAWPASSHSRAEGGSPGTPG